MPFEKTSEPSPQAGEPSRQISISFSEKELGESLRLMEWALREDAASEDLTSEALFGSLQDPLVREFAFVARTPGRLCGVAAIVPLFERFAPEVETRPRVVDGAPLRSGEAFLTLRGPLREVLALERAALNFLGRLCGVATETARWTEAIEGTSARLFDTRKTTPGWRHLEKYAVRCGGGYNHRIDLAGGVLVKDNHLEVLRQLGEWDGPRALSKLRQQAKGKFVEVEVDRRDDFLDVLPLDIDVILLDNFSVEDVRWAVEERNRRSAKVELEASGGIRFENVRDYAETGVDRIAVGAITHSAVVLDIGLDYLDGYGIEP